MFAFNDLITPLTKEQIQESIYDVLGIVGTAITSWKPLSPVRTMILGVSIILASLSTLMADIARSGFLETASGDWLRLIAQYVYGIDPEIFEATFAAGEVTLTNTGGGVYTMDAGDVVLVNPTTGSTYRNTDSWTLNALSSLTVSVVAIEAGSASTSPPATITELETTLLGVTVTNANALVGRDEMKDTEVRALCSEKLGSLSPFGPRDAYSYAARTATRADGTRVGVTRVRTIPDGFGTTTTYVATATGAVTGDPDNIATDLGAVNDAVQRRAGTLSNTADVESAVNLTIPIAYQAWVYNTTGYTPSQVEELVATRLTGFTAAQPISGNIIGADPGKVFVDAIRTSIGSTLGEIFHVVVTSPSADVVLEPEEVPVLGTVTGSITLVTPGDGF